MANDKLEESRRMVEKFNRGRKPLGLAEAQALSAVASKPDDIKVYPNENHDGYKDNWTCEHADFQTGKADGDTWLCEACADLHEAGAQIVKVGKVVVYPDPDGTGWICEHVPAQRNYHVGRDEWLCESCTDLLDAGAQAVDELGKPVKWGKSAGAGK